MPGKSEGRIRPVGNGVIWDRGFCPLSKTYEKPWPTNHTVPYGTGFSLAHFQAFHAWLPSGNPSGTELPRTLGQHPEVVAEF